MSKPVALITGVGDGTGAALARRFAQGGYRVAMLARNRERLKALENEIADAKGYVCDIGDLDALMATVETVRSEMGVPSALVHNAVSATFKHGYAQGQDRAVSHLNSLPSHDRSSCGRCTIPVRMRQTPTCTQK